MKKLALLITFLVLTGCAAHVPFHLVQKEKNKTIIAGIKNVEIFYHPDNFTFPVRQSGGLLALLSIGEDIRNAERTIAFKKAVENSFPLQDINQAFANELADVLKRQGKKVKITQISRPIGHKSLSKSDLSEVKPQVGYIPIVLRITAGYYASSFAGDYYSFSLVEYALLNAKGERTLVNSADRGSSKSRDYSNFDDLLANHKLAYNSLNSEIIAIAPRVYSALFDLKTIK